MISHKHKCIFLHIPRTGGTSINSFFHPGVPFHYAKPDYERLFGWCPKRQIHMQHATSKQLLATGLVTEKIWKEYFVFTFVRNPWDRAYSDFNWIQKFAGVEGTFEEYLQKEGAFSGIFNGDNLSNKFLGDHLYPQTDFFDLNGKYKPNFIGRFENFEKDIQKVLKEIGIAEKFNIHYNRSKRKRKYMDFYSKRQIELVEEKFQKDILLLNYNYVQESTFLERIKSFLKTMNF